MKVSMPFNISRRFMRVWNRNLIVYRKIWLINFLPPLFEPVFYLLAFGFGLSSFIEKISFEGYALSYIRFIAPSLLAVTIMYNAFFENTYASFVRMYYQKTFDAMMATPLSMEEVITGEIVWGATKSVIATGIMFGVVSLFGLVQFPYGLLILPLAFLGGLAFGSIGMLFTGIVPSIDTYNLPIFLFITPMFLFSGTFFPLENLPYWAQKMAIIFPLTHLVRLTRYFSLGMVKMDLLWDVAYLAIFSMICFPLAVAAMYRRLIH
ncbi:transport permease protein [Desulforhabdus amnigena]|uniref:Transport permease protein n=2 Tax=Desulforhabdus amnigena TaxID=40218 RepID=A0A9W6FRR7_9BACT|nr:transport permease protein [Desulforhabdus amnigena]